MTRFGAVLGLGLALLSGPARAQTWQVFDMATAGFPSDNITDIVQDTEGTIWAATS